MMRLLTSYRTHLLNRWLRFMPGAKPWVYPNVKQVVWLRDRWGSTTPRIVHEEVVKGAYEPPQALPWNALVVDIGAHVGGWCIPFALANPQVHVIACEPNPTTYRYLKWNLKRNGVKNVTAFHVALGDGNYVTCANEWPNTGGSKTFFHGARADARSLTLAEIVDGCWIDLLKLDCEGGEYSLRASDFDLLVAQVVGEVHLTRPGQSQKEVLELLRSVPHRLTVQVNHSTQVQVSSDRFTRRNFDGEVLA